MQGTDAIFSILGLLSYCLSYFMAFLCLIGTEPGLAKKFAPEEWVQYRVASGKKLAMEPLIPNAPCAWFSFETY